MMLAVPQLLDPMRTKDDAENKAVMWKNIALIPKGMRNGELFQFNTGEDWVQESLLGSRFVASYRWLDRSNGRIEPTITGEAFVNADCTVVVDPHDPFRWGIDADR